MGSHLCSEEWGTKLREVALEKQMMNKLVMDYLVIEGHKDAAARFMSESGTPCEVDLDSIVDRVSIRTALEAGNVEDAVEGTNNLDLQILRRDPALLFHLKQQQLIEYIRNGDVDRALSFAQGDLAPMIENGGGTFVDELEQTMMLLAYERPADCPTAHLLGQEQRRKTASELNAAILQAQKQQQEPRLPMMVRMMQWAQAELQEEHHVRFPVIDDVAAAEPKLRSHDDAPLTDQR